MGSQLLCLLLFPSLFARPHLHTVIGRLRPQRQAPKPAVYSCLQPGGPKAEPSQTFSLHKSVASGVCNSEGEMSALSTRAHL